MRDWNPRRLWNALRETLHGWMDDGAEDEPARDPALLFHLLFSVPLLLALLATWRQLAP